jgi:hypothetical protein
MTDYFLEKCSTQSNFMHDNKATSGNCALLGYYTVSCGNFLPIGENLSVTEHCQVIITTQKSTVLINFVAEA